MVKESLLVTVAADKYPSVLQELLQEKFEIVWWNGDVKLTKNQLMENIRGKFGIVCTPGSVSLIDRDVIEAAGNTLKVISTLSSGVDHLDIEELKSKNIRIGYAPDISIAVVAEYAIALLLAAARNVVKGHNAILKLDKWNHMSWSGFGLYKSTTAVIGCGKIGVSILKKLKIFEPRTLFYYSRSKKPEAEEWGAKLESLDTIMKKSDFIVVALEMNAQTKGIINRDMINSMKSDAVLVNIGRGGLLDEDALIEALKNRKIAGAGLDVFNIEPLPHDSPLMKLDNVVLSPHIAYNSRDCLFSITKLAALNVLAVLNGTEMPAEFL